MINFLIIWILIPILSKIFVIVVLKNIMSQNTPQSIAAGCIYYYIKKQNLNINKKHLSDICKISGVYK